MEAMNRPVHQWLCSLRFFSSQRLQALWMQGIFGDVFVGNDPTTQRRLSSFSQRQLTRRFGNKAAAFNTEKWGQGSQEKRRFLD
jgi:hypothetical protein